MVQADFGAKTCGKVFGGGNQPIEFVGCNLLTKSAARKIGDWAMRNLLLVVIFSGSAVSQDAPAELLRALKAEALESRLVIGEHYGGEFHFIDTTLPNEPFRVASQYAREKDGPSLILKHGAESQTSDGEWSASCKHRANCTITNKRDSNKRFVLKFKGVLTSLYWSPDEKFVFYIVKAPAFRFPMRCGFDDERDVIVYQISTGLHGLLTTVCGASFVDLRWWEFDKPLPLSPELIKRP